MVQLEHLLFGAIDRSGLFLALAGDDYAEPPRDDPAGRNWAQKELDHAQQRAAGRRRPKLRLVDLGRAPRVGVDRKVKRWRYSDADALADRVAAEIGLAKRLPSRPQFAAGT